jgi:hypothetical protein
LCWFSVVRAALWYDLLCIQCCCAFKRRDITCMSCFDCTVD